MRRWPQRRRLHSDLHALWRPLVEAFPEICLNPPVDPSTAARLPLRDSRGALYRVVIEIHDGLRRLRAYAAAPETLTGVTGREDRAAAALNIAAYVDMALWAHDIGTAVVGEPAQPPGHLLQHCDRDVDAEARWLAQIAVAYRARPRRRTTSHIAAQPNVGSGRRTRHLRVGTSRR